MVSGNPPPAEDRVDIDKEEVGDDDVGRMKNSPQKPVKGTQRGRMDMDQCLKSMFHSSTDLEIDCYTQLGDIRIQVCKQCTHKEDK